VALVVLLLGGELCPLRPGERPRPVASALDVAERTPSPGLMVEDLDGHRWDLAGQRGRVVLVNLFATWCPPCRAEMPELVGIARDYQTKGVGFLGLSLDEAGAKVVRPFVKRYGMPFPVAVAQQGMEFTAGVTGIPVTVLIDRSGRTARTYVGQISADEVRRDLDALLAEPTPAVPAAR
jgi:thiol-disulfide isomerase/thioredoxin